MKLVSLVLVSMMTLGGVAAADPGPRPARAQIRQMLLQRFDRNHDGRLERREKRQAIRALRRMARQLAMSDRGGRRRSEPANAGERGETQRIIRRYDRNGDGNVGPAEMPPGLANRLRPLDRNGDGWVNDDDFGGPEQ
jgi:Ca2+-binding EF-hand superfamily protein